jgi:hypothetical protein
LVLFEQGNKEFRLNQFSNCADGNDYIAKFTGPDHPDGHINQFVLAGEMEAAYDIAGPMELHIESKKCSQTGKNCAPLPTTIIENLCAKFDDRNAFWTPFIDGTAPRLGCPIKKVRSNQIDSNKNCVKLTPSLSK